MKDSTVSTIVGATTLAGILGFAYLLTAIGGLGKFMEGGYEITVELPTAGGLQTDSRVYYNGIDIGRIESVRFQDAPRQGVIAVALIIDEEVPIPDDVTVLTRYPSMLGGSAVADLIRDEGDVAGHLAKDGSAVISGEPAIEFGQLAGELRNSLSGPLGEFERISDNFDALSKEWTIVAQNINQLVEARSTDEVDSGNAMGNLATVLARTDQRLVELKEAIDGVNTYVNDPELRDDVRTTAANARELTQRFNHSVHTLRAKYVDVADDLSETVQAMKELANQTLEGGGTLGKMVSDPEHYENLNDASQRLNTALDEVKLLVEKWKAEGLPVQF